MSAMRWEKFAQHHLAITDVSGEEAMVRCPVHDDSKASMQFNLRSGLWVCFACGEGGSIKRLCRELGIDVVDDEPQPDLQDVRRKLRLLQMDDKQKKGPKIQPESLLLRYKFPTDYWGPCPKGKKPKGCTGDWFDCKMHRWFTDETVKAFEFGFDIMNNAATIPIRNINHQLLGVIRRFLDEDVDLRYRYPKGFKRSQNIMFAEMVEESASTTCAVVEGSLDAAAIWQAGIPAVPLLGSSLSLMQVSILRRLGITDLVTFFDKDKAGRKAHDSCIGIKHHQRKGEHKTEYVRQLDLRQHFFVRRVNYEPEMPGDPGQMSGNPKMIRRAVKNASRVR